MRVIRLYLEDGRTVYEGWWMTFSTTIEGAYQWRHEDLFRSQIADYNNDSVCVFDPDGVMCRVVRAEAV